MRKYTLLGLAGLVLLGLPGVMGGADALLLYVPASDVTGTLANSKFVFTGKKFDGDFCAGSRTGVSQGLVVVYTGSDPAAPSEVITTNGENPGTRVAAPTNNGLDCTDSIKGAINEYSGTTD
jgi:hypothetical protein